MTRTRILATLSTLALLLGFVMPASALTVSPPVYDYTLNPGDVIRDTIKISNESNEPLTVYPEVYNFTYTEGEEVNGTPAFYPADEIRDGHELAPWLTVEGGPVILQPGQNSSIGFTMSVPISAQPGSHFGSIQLRNAPSGDTSGPSVGVVGGVGVLILVRVSGDAGDKVSVARFSGDSVLYSRLPVDLFVRLQNEGNTHQRPTGNVFITDMFGRQVASLTVNGDFRSVLPGSARRFDVRWQKREVPEEASEIIKQWKNFGFGKYSATLVLNYGSAGDMKPLTAEYSFWVFPWLALLVIIGGATLLLIVFILGLKRYNRMVISKYERQSRK